MVVLSVQPLIVGEQNHVEKVQHLQKDDNASSRAACARSVKQICGIVEATLAEKNTWHILATHAMATTIEPRNGTPWPL